MVVFVAVRLICQLPMAVFAIKIQYFLVQNCMSLLPMVEVLEQIVTTNSGLNFP